MRLPDELIHLASVLAYCEKIERLVAETTYGSYKEDELKVDVSAFYFLQIGEMCNSLSGSFREQHNEVNWRALIGMRNRIAHAYGSFDTEIAWEAMTQDIPTLAEFCREELSRRYQGGTDY